MKISDVEIIPLACPLKTSFFGGTYEIAYRYTNVTRISTDEGIVGETYAGDPQTNQTQIVRIIEKQLKSALIGEDPLRIAKIWQKLFDYTVAGVAGLKMEAITALDSSIRATIMQAISALDIALWDILGKTADMPVYKLLGGYRNEIPIIAIGGYAQSGKDVEALIKEAHEYRRQGMMGMKLKVGHSDVAQDVNRLEALREAIGDQFVIACDANQAWTIEQAIKFGCAAKASNIEWLEEPVHWYDELHGLRMVRESVGVPVTAGQGEISRFGCRDLVENKAVDILNVDCSIAGGVTEWRRIAEFAEQNHVRMAHHEEWQIATHLLGSISHGLYAECFPNPSRDPLWFELPRNPPDIKDGFIKIPEKPGFGIELQDSALRKYSARS